MSNRKIKNATPVEYNGIKFRSKKELMVYTTLLRYGLKPEYEPITYTIWEGFRPTVPLYKGNISKLKKQTDSLWRLDVKKLINITYTPDFYIEYEGLKIIIEVKGIVNDVFPYKFKLFRKYIEELPNKENYIIFEVFNKKQLLEFIQIIKDEANRKNKVFIETLA